MGLVYLDVSDVVEYFTYNMTASGIQRVQLEFIRVFAKDPGYRFVIAGGQQQGFILVDDAPLTRLVGHVDAGDFTRAGMDALLKEIRSARGVAKAAAGDIFFVSGAFWASSSTLRSLWAAKEAGALVGFLCYDLIPIRHREFCDEGLAALFEQAFESVVRIVDFIFTISDYVRRDVEGYLAEHGVDVPVRALPLAHELAAQRGSRTISPRVAALMQRPYALFVSTIEARKNHVYALTVWQRLLDRMPDKVPDIIWVGRPGWLVDDLMKRIHRLDHLGGRLKIVSGLSDAELAALYRGSLFSFYPSLAEGWGLPVAESLIFGKTAVVSNTTSLPEVGGDFVDYIDPDNVTDGVRAVERLLLAPARIAEAEARIKAEFKPRLWRDVCADLAAGFAALAAEPPRRNALPTIALRTGAAYPAGGNAIAGGAELSTLERSALDSVFDVNWYASEPWGRWLKGGSGALRLLVPETAGGQAHTIVLHLQMSATWCGRRVSIHCPASGHEAQFKVVAGQRHTLVTTMPLPAGRVEIVLRADREDGSGGLDPRLFSAGLIAFGYARADDKANVDGLLAALPAPMTIRSEAAAVGPVSALKPMQPILPPNDWRVKLMRRTLSEGPRMIAARGLRRGARWLSRGRVG